MLTADEWTQHFNRLLPILEQGDSIRARQLAQNLARDLYENSYLDVSAVGKAARSLPTIGPRPVSQGINIPRPPTDRDEHFDAAMKEFISAFQAALEERSAFEQSIAANATLSRAECRRLVHEFLGTQKDLVFARTIVAETKLNPDQVLDALEQLESEALLHDNTIKSSGTWRTGLNAVGRNLLDGTKPIRGDIVPLQISQQFNLIHRAAQPHTPDDVREAYLAEMPRRRSEFAKAVAEFKAQVFHISNYPAVLPQKLLDLAEEELYRRLDTACEQVERLLESGCIPTTQNGRRDALLMCFERAELHNDPFSDLYAAVDSAYKHMPWPEPKDEPTLRQRLGQLQTWASKAAIKRVETYVVENKPTLNITNNAQVASQQFGDHNTAYVTQPTAIDNRSIHTAITEIEKRIADFPTQEQLEIREHLDTAKDELASDTPRPTKLAAAFKAIGRVAREYSLDAIEKVTTGVTAALIK